jgi:hypothetical protein
MNYALLKAEICSGAVCKLRENLGPRIIVVPPCFWKLSTDGNNGVSFT